MAGRKKLPADVLEHRARSHLTKAEKDARRRAEPVIPEGLARVDAPEYIRQYPGFAERFDEIAGMMSAVMPGSFCALDAPMLAQYVVFEAEYEQACDGVFLAETPKEKREYQRMQMDAFSKARAAAATLGMFVTDRCRITASPAGEDDDVDAIL